MNAHKLLLFSFLFISSVTTSFTCRAMDPDLTEQPKEKKEELEQLQATLKKHDEKFDTYEKKIESLNAQLMAAQNLNNQKDKIIKDTKSAEKETQKTAEKAQKKLTEELKKQETDFEASLKQEKKEKAKVKTEYEYLQQHPQVSHAEWVNFPQEAAPNLSAYYKAQANRCGYETSWKKSGVDFASVVGTQIVVPILIHQLNPLITDWRQSKEWGKTTQDRNNEKIMALNLEIATLDKNQKTQRFELEKLAQESALEQQAKLAKMENQTRLVNQFRLQCDGVDNASCRQMGQMAATVQKAQWHELYKETIGKPYIPQD